MSKFDATIKGLTSSLRTGVYSNFLGIMNVLLLNSMKRCLSNLSHSKKIRTVVKYVVLVFNYV